VQYVVGPARNSRLQAMVAAVESDMKAVFDETGMKQHRLVEFGYGACTWKTPHR
jgi:hypothetical protein